METDADIVGTTYFLQSDESVGPQFASEGTKLRGTKRMRNAFEPKRSSKRIRARDTSIGEEIREEDEEAIPISRDNGKGTFKQAPEHSFDDSVDDALHSGCHVDDEDSVEMSSDGEDEDCLMKEEK